MTDKDIVWRTADSPENKKKHLAEICIMKKSSISGYADYIMSLKMCYQHEHPCNEMLKVVDVRDMLDVTEDKFNY